MKALDLSFKNKDQIVELLREGKVGVMPTDTIYGIVGSALNPNAVEEIYHLRKRDSKKPMIILISSLDDLLDFDIVLTSKQKEFLQKIWSNPISVVLPCPFQRFLYLHRDKRSLAFRMPNDKNLLKIIEKTGPLVAPSANIAGSNPSETINEAKKYFNNKISFYANSGKLKSKPSTIIQLYEDGAYIVLREGSFVIKDTV